MTYSAFKKISLLLASSALVAAVAVIGGAAQAAPRVEDGAGSGSSSGGRDKLSPIVRSCASFDPVTRRSKLVPCDSTAQLCQPNATSQRTACSITADSCKGQAETLTGFQTVTWNDGCGSSWNTTETCRVSCPYVAPSCYYVWNYNVEGGGHNFGRWLLEGSFPSCFIQKIREMNMGLWFNHDGRPIFGMMRNLNFAPRFFDGNCESASNRSAAKVCGTAKFSFTTPLSLVWQADHTLESEFTLTKFPLDIRAW